MHMCLYLISKPISNANTLLTNAEVLIKIKPFPCRNNSFNVGEFAPYPEIIITVNLVIYLSILICASICR